MQVSNWGKYPVVTGDLSEFESAEEGRKLIHASESLIVRGLGRSYGDASLNSQMLSSLRFNRLMAFDAERGLVRCEAGVSLEDLLRVFLPRGWFLPVTPGTKFVTVGGAIAADIHGKNHHKEGSFAKHVRSLELMLANGQSLTCSAQESPELFAATCGGMGLTGLILNATLQLKPVETAYIVQETIPAPNLEAIMDLFERSERWTYTVAWIDCLSLGANLGRSIMIRGEHATRADLLEAQRTQPLRLHAEPRLNVPWSLPGWALNQWSVKAFNELYYRKHPAALARSVVGYDGFFYPLDAIHHWNRIYGKHGFTQYQFVLPKAQSRQGVAEILERIAHQGQGSFLAVLKLFGHQEGLISFPMEGYTLALDFAIRPGLWEFLEELDQIVLRYGGRLYLAKDARMKRDMFCQSYPHVETFLKTLHTLPNPGKFQSLQSRRVGLTA